MIRITVIKRTDAEILMKQNGVAYSKTLWLNRIRFIYQHV